MIEEVSALEVKGALIDLTGNQLGSIVSYAAGLNITSAYALPVDTLSNQYVNYVLSFLQTSSGLDRIINNVVSATPTLGSFDSKSMGKPALISAPLLIPRNDTTNYLVLPFANSIEIYQNAP